MFSRSFMSDSCDPIDCSLPGSSVHGIPQARLLEWVAMPSSRVSSRPRDGTCIGRWVLYHLTTWEGPVRRVVAVVQWLYWVRLFATLWTEVQPHFPVLHYLLEFAQTPALSQ